MRDTAEHGGVKTAEADVTVVGMGMGGTAAALAASETGARVIVLEGGPVPGGSARFARGLLWTATDLESFLRIDPQASPALLRLVVERFEGDAAWLRGYGLETGPKLPGLYGIGMGYRILSDLSDVFVGFQKALEDRGATVQTDHSVKSVTKQRGGGWVVAGRTSVDKPFRIRTRTLVLATGGYAGAGARLAEWFGPVAERLIPRVNPFSDGTAVRLAEELGLKLTGSFDRFYGHLVPYGIKPSPAEFGPITLSLSEFGLLVNREGRRFTEESRGDWFSAEALVRQADGLGYLILDDEAVRLGRSTPRYPGAAVVDTLAALRTRGVAVAQNEDPGDLAESMAQITGMPGHPPAQALRETLAAFNASAVEQGRRPLNRPPYVGIPVVAGITFGKGGLGVNERLQVLRADGEAVPDLFAAGVDIGGLYAEAYAGGLAPALVTGRLAGQHAAASGQRKREG